MSRWYSEMMGGPDGRAQTRILLGYRAKKVADNLVFLGMVPKWWLLENEVARILLWIQDPTSPLMNRYLTRIVEFSRWDQVRVVSDDFDHYGSLDIKLFE